MQNPGGPKGEVEDEVGVDLRQDIHQGVERHHVADQPWDGKAAEAVFEAVEKCHVCEPLIKWGWPSLHSKRGSGSRLWDGFKSAWPCNGPGRHLLAASGDDCPLAQRVKCLCKAPVDARSAARDEDRLLCQFHSRILTPRLRVVQQVKLSASVLRARKRRFDHSGGCLSPGFMLWYFSEPL